MVEKLVAELKDVPTAISAIDTGLIGKDWLMGTNIINETKKRLLYDMKQELHKKIELLDLDDLKFRFIK